MHRSITIHSIRSQSLAILSIFVVFSALSAWADQRSVESAPPQAPSQQSGTLLSLLKVELKHKGKVVGSTILKPGTTLPIVKQDGTRALVKHMGGESWAQAASTWEGVEVMDYRDKPKPNVEGAFYVLSADLAMHGDEPKLEHLR